MESFLTAIVVKPNKLEFFHCRIWITYTKEKFPTSTKVLLIVSNIFIISLSKRHHIINISKFIMIYCRIHYLEEVYCVWVFCFDKIHHDNMALIHTVAGHLVVSLSVESSLHVPRSKTKVAYYRICLKTIWRF